MPREDAAMISELEHTVGTCFVLLSVRVTPFHGEVLDATDADTGEPVPAILFAPSQTELNQWAALTWADEEGRL